MQIHPPHEVTGKIFPKANITYENPVRLILNWKTYSRLVSSLYFAKIKSRKIGQKKKTNSQTIDLNISLNKLKAPTSVIISILEEGTGDID